MEIIINPKDSVVTNSFYYHILKLNKHYLLQFLQQFKMKIRVYSEDGIELPTICRQLKSSLNNI